MMLYWSDQSPFHDKTQWDDVTRIMLTAKSGQHTIRFDVWNDFITSEYVRQYREVSNWRDFFELLEQLAMDDLHAALLDRATDLLTAPKGRFAAIGPRLDAASFVVPFGAAAGWCMSPLVVWTENQTDGVLLQAALSTHSNINLSASVRRWIEIRGCGGIPEVKKRARESLDETVPPRALAIIDSDRLQAGPPSADALEIREILGARVWILEKRALENYLPGRLVVSRATAREKKRAKSYYNLGPTLTAFLAVKSHLPARLVAEALTDLPSVDSRQMVWWNGDELERLVMWVAEWL